MCPFPPLLSSPPDQIVMCSWVTFWLIKTEKGGEVPARTGLGANSVLSVVNIGFSGESRPQVVPAVDCLRTMRRAGLPDPQK